jgi:hypothetical protein
VCARRLIQSVEMNFDREPEEEGEEGGEGGQSPRSLRSDTSIGLVWNKRTGLRVRPNPIPRLTLLFPFRAGPRDHGSRGSRGSIG